MSVPAHVERMHAEAAELQDRLDKLGQFIDGNAVFFSLPHLDQELLKSQFFAMRAYCSILNMRLARAR